MAPRLRAQCRSSGRRQFSAAPCRPAGEGGRKPEEPDDIAKAEHHPRAIAEGGHQGQQTAQAPRSRRNRAAGRAAAARHAPRPRREGPRPRRRSRCRRPARFRRCAERATVVPPPPGRWAAGAPHLGQCDVADQPGGDDQRRPRAGRSRAPAAQGPARRFAAPRPGRWPARPAPARSPRRWSGSRPTSVRDARPESPQSRRGRRRLCHSRCHPERWP